MFDVMKEMFDELMENIMKNGMDFLDWPDVDKNDKNEPIEKILHKYELEIRAHIKMENEFKKVAEESEL